MLGSSRVSFRLMGLRHLLFRRALCLFSVSEAGDCKAWGPLLPQKELLQKQHSAQPTCPFRRLSFRLFSYALPVPGKMSYLVLLIYRMPLSLSL